METQGPHISDLPVDALLEVFCRLPAADLTLGATGVCRAWRELAMEPAAWQGRRVQVSADPLEQGLVRQGLTC